MKIDISNYPRITCKSDNIRFELSSVLQNSFKVDSQSILMPNKSKMNFWSYGANLAKKKTGKLVEMVFFGLNYNAKRIRYARKPYVLDLQKSHKIKVDEKRVSEIKTKVFKRRILFFSYNRNSLLELTNSLKNKRPQNSYSGHGLIERDDKYVTKPGKVRQK